MVLLLGIPCTNGVLERLDFGVYHLALLGEDLYHIYHSRKYTSQLVASGH